jgi:hypothetical protein
MGGLGLRQTNRDQARHDVFAHAVEEGERVARRAQAAEIWPQFASFAFFARCVSSGECTAPHSRAQLLCVRRDLQSSQRRVAGVRQ